jgi:hypothetical protein
MTLTSKPTQKQLNPSNPIEAMYLEQTSIYFGQHQDLMIDQLQMNSAANDLQAIDIKELVWPTKTISVPKEVSFALPGRDNLVKEMVNRETRVPMTAEEAALHFAERAGLKAYVVGEGKLQIGGEPPKAAKKPAAKKSAKEALAANSPAMPKSKAKKDKK